jgi:hypothetical protein
MAYLSDDPHDDVESRWWSRIGGFAAWLVGFFVVSGLVKFVIAGGAVGTTPNTPERLDAFLQSNAEAGELYAAIKANYPDDYRQFLQQTSETIRTGNRAAIERQAFNFSRNVMVNHFDDMARAPSADLHAIARQYAALANTLKASDISLCSQFITTGFAPGTAYPEAIRPILRRIGTMQIAAARHGETQPRDPRGEISEHQALQFAEAIRARSPSATRLLLNESALSGASPAEQCDAGVALYEAAANLPSDAAADVTIQLLRASFAGNSTS